MSKLICITKKENCIRIESIPNKEFITLTQGDDYHGDQLIRVNKKDWNEFVHNLTLFNITK